MISIFRRSWALLCAAVALTANPVDLSAETLADALVLAYSSNADLQAARQALRARNELHPQALAGWLPTLQWSRTLVRDANRTDSSALRTYGNQREWTASLNLFRGGRDVANIGRAGHAIRRERAQLQQTEQIVLLSGIEAYLGVFREQEILRFTRESVQALEAIHDTTFGLYEARDRTEADLAQAEAQLASGLASRASAETRLAAAVARYVQVVGVAPVELALPQPFQPLPSSEVALIQVAERLYPPVIAAEEAEKTAEEDISVEIASALPQIDLVGTQTRTKSTYNSGTATDTEVDRQVTLQIVVPLYQGGGDHARIREARKIHSQRRFETQAAQRSARENATRAWQDLEGARARLVVFERAVAAAQRAVDSISVEVESGRRMLQDLLAAQVTLLGAQVNFVTARTDLVSASFRVVAAVGSLTVDTLALPVERFKDDYETIQFRIFDPFSG